MHLVVGVGAHDELAVAERGEVAQGLVGVEGPLGLEEELVAVAELRALPVVVELDLDAGVGHVVGLGGRGGGVEVGELLAAVAKRGVHEGLEEGGKAIGTGVDHAVLLEDGQEVGRAGHGLVGLHDERLEGLGDGHLLLLGAVCAGRHVADDGEDGALDRLAHGLEGHLHAVAQGRGHVGRGHGVMRGDEALGQAAQNLARNDAGVAARAHERAVRDGLGHIGHRGVGGQRLDLLHDGPQRERHVGAGVAVGHGEDVELVDLLGLVGHGLCRDGEARTDNGGNHGGKSLQIIGPVAGAAPKAAGRALHAGGPVGRPGRVGFDPSGASGPRRGP